ncbi:MAG: FG-GAP-like repeat-containing protein [Sphingobacteriales bacterium JAD_PAG50586_3]|nr:MAG: FG-GAP-like repeat-containing protein [Sphingobacteriales bacterium JAD_PAG50586_3]
MDENVTSFGYSAPFLLDSASTTQMIVGSHRGQLFYFNNIDDNLNGTFNLVDSVFTGFRKFGTFAAPAAADINNDGYLDVIIGNIAGDFTLHGNIPNRSK